ncbi:hypothetical protein M0R45_016148 [Rubus argutus]|uniref:Uncharacterized protein n=1 Tax=Rubus argutus TaxID=59490 RepID=A0AAW1XSK4_RUBAR
MWAGFSDLNDGGATLGNSEMIYKARDSGDVGIDDGVDWKRRGCERLRFGLWWSRQGGERHGGAQRGRTESVIGSFCDDEEKEIVEDCDREGEI